MGGKTRVFGKNRVFSTKPGFPGQTSVLLANPGNFKGLEDQGIYIAAHDGIKCFFLAAKLSLRRLCGARLNQKSDNFKEPFHSQLLQKKALLHLSVLGLFVGTRLNQETDNFNLPFQRCLKQRRCSICHALVFVGT